MAAAELHDARDSLEYWEERARRLPRYALRRRREARAMASRWRARVLAAERSTYGEGVLSAALMLLAERRLPQRLKTTGRRAARIAVGTAVAVVATCTALFTLAFVALLSLIF
jgi:hypothetical protein